MDTIRILIVDDQTITRSGMQSLLATQPDLEIVAMVKDGQEAIETN